MVSGPLAVVSCVPWIYLISKKDAKWENSKVKRIKHSRRAWPYSHVFLYILDKVSEVHDQYPVFSHALTPGFLIDKWVCHTDGLRKGLSKRPCEALHQSSLEETWSRNSWYMAAKLRVGLEASRAINDKYFAQQLLVNRLTKQRDNSCSQVVFLQNPFKKSNKCI